MLFPQKTQASRPDFQKVLPQLTSAHGPLCTHTGAAAGQTPARQGVPSPGEHEGRKSTWSGAGGKQLCLHWAQGRADRVGQCGLESWGTEAGGVSGPRYEGKGHLNSTPGLVNTTGKPGPQGAGVGDAEGKPPSSSLLPGGTFRSGQRELTAGSEEQPRSAAPTHREEGSGRQAQPTSSPDEERLVWELTLTV